MLDHLLVISGDMFTKEGFYRKQISSLSEQLTLSQNMNDKIEDELREAIKAHADLLRDQDDKVVAFQRQLAESRES